MFVLIEFSPIKPDFGLLFWTTIIFALFWMLMSRFAFGPIKDALKKREETIDKSIKEAKAARDEMTNLKAENEKILAEARAERSQMLKDAKEAKANMIAEAKEQAKSEANKIITNAKLEIDNQKKAAITEVKNQAGLMALDIAEKVLRKDLKGDSEQQAFVTKLMQDVKLN
jgi:F-type H+-transporting ATPase subunit b